MVGLASLVLPLLSEGWRPFGLASVSLSSSLVSSPASGAAPLPDPPWTSVGQCFMLRPSGLGLSSSSMLTVSCSVTRSGPGHRASLGSPPRPSRYRGGGIGLGADSGARTLVDGPSLGRATASLLLKSTSALADGAPSRPSAWRVTFALPSGALPSCACGRPSERPRRLPWPLPGSEHTENPVWMRLTVRSPGPRRVRLGTDAGRPRITPMLGTNLGPTGG